MKDKEKLQKIILIIAKEVDRICKNNNIEYFLDGGTQLGAVRHKGFIPWDDDFDIGMKRKEFEKFIYACKKELNKSEFYLETSEDTGYAFSFAKIHLNGTCIIEDFSKSADVHHGIFVDIFPYDKLPQNRLNRKLFLFINNLLKNLIWIKLNYGDDFHRKKISYKIFKFLGKALPISLLKRKRNYLIQKYNYTNSDYYFNSDYSKKFISKYWIDDIVDYNFEKYNFKGVKDYDSFLRNLYGNYMNMPPEEERVCHSNYNVDFGKY